MLNFGKGPFSCLLWSSDYFMAYQVFASPSVFSENQIFLKFFVLDILTYKSHIISYLNMLTCFYASLVLLIIWRPLEFFYVLPFSPRIKFFQLKMYYYAIDVHVIFLSWCWNLNNWFTKQTIFKTCIYHEYPTFHFILIQILEFIITIQFSKSWNMLIELIVLSRPGKIWK